MSGAGSSRRVLALAWLVAALLLAVHQFQLWRQPAFATDVTALLPTQADPDLEQATERLVAAAATQWVVLVGAPDFEQTKQAAQAALAVLDPEQREHVANAAGALPAGLMAPLAAARGALLTRADRQWLGTATDADIGQRALQNLLQPFGDGFSSWRDDPLGLWANWLRERAAWSPLRPRDGWLWLEQDGIEWIALPFNAGEFDLVVIDEASQCDIASALPLLYRAKRAVIIGDPMQLRHISAMGKVKDADLQNKYGLIENRATWMYSVNSLYDLAAGIASPQQIVNLRDHHRCHADIISFSNKMFYGGRLRVATRYSSLKRRSNREPGVVWQDVRGNVTRPGGSGARNIPEANAVCEALHDLLVTRGYTGSVGVVTPFRSQVQVLEELVARSEVLSRVGPKADLLVDSVHGFQGDERDVMFFSPVVSVGISPGALGFLRSNGNLFNVAITRARGLLQVVGDRSAASTSGIDYLERFSEQVAGLDTPTGGAGRPSGPTRSGTAA